MNRIFFNAKLNSVGEYLWIYNLIYFNRFNSNLILSNELINVCALYNKSIIYTLG